MSKAPGSVRVHPTAVIDPGAILGDGVEIGPFCVVEDNVSIGAGTRLREHVVVRRYTSLGESNYLDAGVEIQLCPDGTPVWLREVVVRIEAQAICGSDLHALYGKPGEKANIPGHEAITSSSS